VPRWSRWFVFVVGAYWTYDYFGNLIYSQSVDWSTLIFFASVLTPVAAQIYRYRRVSTPAERQQTKWVVFGFAICMVGFVLVLTVKNLLLPKELLESSVMSTFVAQTACSGPLLLIPISIAIAILRSRLYDIDVLINRTLVYGSLTVILAVIYIAGVVGAQAIVNAFAQRQSSDPSPILIVVTTFCSRRAVPAATPPPATGHRPSLLSPQIQRRADAGHVQCHAPPGSEPERSERPSTRGSSADDGTDEPLAVAPFPHRPPLSACTDYGLQATARNIPIRDIPGV
jgi:hypothetical protein